MNLTIRRALQKVYTNERIFEKRKKPVIKKKKLKKKKKTRSVVDANNNNTVKDMDTGPDLAEELLANQKELPDPDQQLLDLTNQKELPDLDQQLLDLTNQKELPVLTNQKELSEVLDELLDLIPSSSSVPELNTPPPPPPPSPPTELAQLLEAELMDLEPPNDPFLPPMLDQEVVPGPITHYQFLVDTSEICSYVETL